MESPYPRIRIIHVKPVKPNPWLPRLNFIGDSFSTHRGFKCLEIVLDKYCEMMYTNEFAESLKDMSHILELRIRDDGYSCGCFFDALKEEHAITFQPSKARRQRGELC